jgi:hypothetical protein
MTAPSAFFLKNFRERINDTTRAINMRVMEKRRKRRTVLNIGIFALENTDIEHTHNLPMNVLDGLVRCDVSVIHHKGSLNPREPPLNHMPIDLLHGTRPNGNGGRTD